MKIWKLGEMYTKVITDLDLQDETFISFNEMMGYFNEALNEAESEIMELNQDYLLTKSYVPFVAGVGRYPLPFNIYANKIRKFMYQNGSIIYPIKQYRRMDEFENIAYTDQYGQADYYRFILVNDTPGQAQIDLHPVARESAVLTPPSSVFYPGVLWYIRNCTRVPLLAEYCNPEIIYPTQVSVGGNTISTNAGLNSAGVPHQGLPGGWPGSQLYVTGDAVQFQPGPGGTLPAPLVAGVTYYVIAQGAGVVKLATTLANAVLGTALTLTTVGTVYHTMTVAATQAIILAQLIDIPEFATFVMQWVKCRCMEKEGDPRLEGASQTLVQQKKQMVDTLTVSQPDDENLIEADFSHYNEMS